MTKLIPYLPGHLDFIEPLDCYGEGGKERTEQHYENGQCMTTIVVDSAPIAVMGWQIGPAHVLSVWALAGKGIRNSPLAYHRTMKKLIDTLVVDNKIERVQSLINVDNADALRQHDKLGFEIEATLAKVGPHKEDQYLLRRLISGS